MQKFATEDGTNYVLSIDVGVIRRVRSATGVDLLDPTGERTQPAASDQLRSDLVKLVEVIASACNVEDLDAFLAEMKGSVLRSAVEAFWREWSDFFRGAGEELLANQVLEIYEATCAVAAAAAKKTKGLFKKARARMLADLDQEVEQIAKELTPDTSGTSSGTGPASSV